ncbi:unnamed protein product [Parajaminaea phylloscopi]
MLYLSLSPSREPVACSAAEHSNPSIPDVSHLNPSVIEDASAPMKERMETYIKLLQHKIVIALQGEEPLGRFLVDSWQRKEGGEGISCIVQGGSTFEKAGCNVSVVHGNLPLGAIKQMNSGRVNARLDYKLEGPDAEVTSLPFVAMGLSLVVHPENPFAPTVHFNYRYFEIAHPKTLRDGSPNPRYIEGSTTPAAWWFGGGTDLTPIYLFEEDARDFHQELKRAADRHDANFYPAWKKWCDEYFWIPHRGESRGVGGVFFDDLTIPSTWSGGDSVATTTARGKREFVPLLESRPGQAETVMSSAKQHDVESLFATVRSMGNSFLPSYLPIVRKRKSLPFTAEHVAWQGIRRGRYAEFNLVYDRGTKFGLQTPGARIESILMSLPLKARWEYMHPISGTGSIGKGGQDGSDVPGNSEEAKLQRILRQSREWA